MDTPLATPAPAVASPAPAPPPPPVSETVTLGSTGASVALPKVDADVLVKAGLATAPAAPPQMMVLTKDAGGLSAGAVVSVAGALVARLGASARPASDAEVELGGPNHLSLTRL